GGYRPAIAHRRGRFGAAGAVRFFQGVGKKLECFQPCTPLLRVPVCAFLEDTRNTRHLVPEWSLKGRKLSWIFPLKGRPSKTPRRFWRCSRRPFAARRSFTGIFRLNRWRRPGKAW